MNEPASEAVKSRLDILSSGNPDDRGYELLADDQRIHYFIEDRLQREYAVGEPDFLQLYQNVCGSAFLTFRRKYVFVSGDSGTDYAGACHFTGAAFE